jgi:type 1 glutamine amidotransferase
VSAPRAFLLTGQATSGGRQFHNTPDHWACLGALLRGVELDARVISDDLDDLNPANLARFDVILNYSTDYEPSEAQLSALLEAVRGGIGYVGLHAATATFRGRQPYHELVGSWFNRHDPIKRFWVEIDGSHPVTAGVPSFESEDELYELRDVLPDCRLLASAAGWPQVYVRQYGAGRVAYIAPGHDRRTLERPEYAQLVQQAIAWAARDRVNETQGVAAG